MKSEKGICLLLLLCGHALVGAELRGTIAEKGDHERALQTASCSAYPACMALGPGLENIDCCPTIQGQFKNCCYEDPIRTDVPAPTDTIPLPPTTTTAPSTIPLPPTTTTAPSTIPLSPTPTTAPPVSEGLCGVQACLDLGALTTQACCPSKFGQMWSCCSAPPTDATRTDVPAPTDTIPLPPTTSIPPVSTVRSAYCVDNPGCNALGAIPADQKCCPPPGTNQNKMCCGW
jgi:hypothetical protein